MARPDNTKVWRDINHNNFKDVPSANSSGDYINDAWGQWDNNGEVWKPTKDLNAVKKFVENYLKTKITKPGAEGTTVDDRRNKMFNSIFDNMTTIGDDKEGGGLQNFLVKQGYGNLKVDDWAGAQTMSALKDYIDREVEGQTDYLSNDLNHPTLAYGRLPAATTLGEISITPKIETWNEHTSIAPNPSAGPTWNRRQIRNYGDVLNVTSNSIGAMNEALNPYGLKFNDSDLGKLYTAVGNRGSRGGWDRARERAIANREYTLTKGRDNRYYLKFNSNRLNNNAGNSYGYDITSLIGSNLPIKTQPTTSTNTQPTAVTPSNNNTTSQNTTSNNMMPPRPEGLSDEDWAYRLEKIMRTAGYKTGGKMTQKYQTGGAAPGGDPQQQIIQLVQAAMSGDQQASAQIQ